MPTVSPVSHIPLPIAREHSYLASPRESDSVLRQGKRANETNGQLDSALKAVNNALRAMEKTRRRILGGAASVSPAATQTGFNFRGLWSPDIAYDINDAVLMGSGTASGIYLCLTASNTNSPDSGIGWVQLMNGTGVWL